MQQTWKGVCHPSGAYLLNLLVPFLATHTHLDRLLHVPGTHHNTVELAGYTAHCGDELARHCGTRKGSIDGQYDSVGVGVTIEGEEQQWGQNFRHMSLLAEHGVTGSGRRCCAVRTADVRIQKLEF